MDRKETKVSFNKSGGTAVNGITNRITIRTSWVKDMGITIDDPYVIVEYDEEKKKLE